MKRQLSKEEWTSIMDGIRRSEKDFKPNIYTPRCGRCKLYTPSTTGTLICERFSTGIPTAILANEESCPMFEQK